MASLSVHRAAAAALPLVSLADRVGQHIAQSLDFAAVAWCSRLLYKGLRFYSTVRVFR